MGVPVGLIDAGDALVWLSTAAVVWFVVQYTLSSPWWRDPVGRTLIAKDIALLVLLAPSCILLARPSSISVLAATVIEVASLGAIFAVMVWRCTVWWLIRPPRLRRRRSAD